MECARMPALAPFRRPRLAYVSPLPPARSGIADYSAELLAELILFYDIEVIVAQTDVSDPWIPANCRVRSSEWFVENSGRFDRVLYHFGNSEHHQHMFSMLDQVPGVVMLHDFFLSGVVAHMDWHGLDRNAWPRELYRAHGYSGVRERFHAADRSDVVYKFPCNLGVLRKALGIIVHSHFSRRLANQWYGSGTSPSWFVIPLLRRGAAGANRQRAREELGFAADSILVCSFGGLNPTKLNHRLLNCWLQSALIRDGRHFLVFVGVNDSGEYGAKLLETIRDGGLVDWIRINGWLDP